MLNSVKVRLGWVNTPFTGDHSIVHSDKFQRKGCRKVALKTQKFPQKNYVTVIEAHIFLKV